MFKEEEINKLSYRPGVGLMIINSKLEVFVGKRIDSKYEAWQMPQGGIDEGEVPEEAVFREMFEETGTDKIEIIDQTKGWYKYDIPPYLIQKLWNGQYRGQRQKWFLIRYLGDDSDFNLNSGEHAEFKEWKWVKMEELSHVIVPFKKKLYISVIEEFRDVIMELKKDVI